MSALVKRVMKDLILVLYIIFVFVVALLA